MEEQQPHTQLTTEINTDSAVIVGDPARVDKATEFLENVQGWAFNREYKSIIGTYKNKRILVMSTGIGAPSAGIGVEELHNVNVKNVIRVGVCWCNAKRNWLRRINHWRRSSPR